MLTFLERFKTTATQYSDGGAVHCPVRKQDIELDHCFGCARLASMSQVEGVLQVHCRVSGRPAL
jgi:hypothetical protein